MPLSVPATSGAVTRWAAVALLAAIAAAAMLSLPAEAQIVMPSRGPFRVPPPAAPADAASPAETPAAGPPVVAADGTTSTAAVTPEPPPASTDSIVLPRAAGGRSAAFADAEAGDVAAQLALGLQQLSPGAGASPRQAEAYRWFSRAARTSDPRAFLAVGYLHAEGIGTPRNLGQARDFLERALDAGLPRANLLLATIEQALPPGQRRENPLELLRAGAAAGDGPSANGLGALLESQGNLAGAEDAYRAAEAAGSRAATQNLARLTALRERGSRTTVTRLTDRARLGDADAAYELAVRRHRGDGTPVNYGEAIRWYERASQGGNAGAKRMLNLIASRPSPTGDINVAWLQELAAQAVPESGDGPRPGVANAPVPEPNPLVGLLAMRGLPAIEAPTTGAIVLPGLPGAPGFNPANPALPAAGGVRPPAPARVRAAPPGTPAGINIQPATGYTGR